MGFMELLKNRYSVRKFSDRQMEKEKLAAAEQGLDTCWCNYFANSKLEEIFELPANEKSVLIMPIGYADESAKPAPGHAQKKALPEVVKYL